MSAGKPLTSEKLQKMELFRLVPQEAIEGILEASSIMELPKGELLLHLDQSNDSLFLILSGSLSVRLHSLHAEPVDYLLPGECAGELSLIDKKGVSAFVVAENDCRLLVLNDELLWSLMQVSHAASCNMLKIITRRLRNANRKISSRIHLEEEIHRYGTLDALTGIHNRYWFDKILPRLIRRLEKNGQPLSLIMFDIDHFKEFNDQHGHICGDQAINTVGQVLMENLRTDELAARFGGDEFLILLPNIDLDQAESVAERIRKKILNTAIKMGDGSIYPPVTVSLGMAQAKKGQAAEKLLSDADAALFRAKQSGRNTISR